MDIETPIFIDYVDYNYNTTKTKIDTYDFWKHALDNYFYDLCKQDFYNLESFSVVKDIKEYRSFIDFVFNELSLFNKFKNNIKFIECNHRNKYILGEYNYKTQEISIYRYPQYSEFDLLFTIAHECVHAKQYQEYGPSIFTRENHISYNNRPTEQEANTTAGIIVSKWIKMNDLKDFIYNPTMPNICYYYIQKET